MSADIAKMDALSLNHWFFKFVMEVAKKFGERYQYMQFPNQCNV